MAIAALLPPNANEFETNTSRSPVRACADEIDRRQTRVAHAVPAVGRQAPRRVGVAEQQPAETELLRAGRAERVTDQRFRGAARHVETEHARDDLALHLVVLRRGGAVQIDVADVARRRAGVARAPRGSRPRRRGRSGRAPRCGSRRTIRRRRRAESALGRRETTNTHAPSPMLIPRRLALNGLQRSRRKRLERVETVQRQQAQAVDAADDRSVAATRRRAGARRRERLGRRRARGRDRVAQAVSPR